MKLTSCRVQNYRSILDSGWVDVDDITTIVGKNESGKTSFLKALWKFNPFNDEPYNIDREWPSGRRKEKSPDKIVVETRFSFSEAEIAEIEQIHESAKGITGVEITRNYAGEFQHKFSPAQPNTEHTVEWVVGLLTQSLLDSPVGCTDHFKGHYDAKMKAIIDAVHDKNGCQVAISKLSELKSQLQSFVHPNHPHNQTDIPKIPARSAEIDSVITKITATPLLRVVDFVHQLLPTFVYMDDHRIFSGAARLDEVQKRKREKRQTVADETILVIMEMSGLDLDEEVRKGGENDREQRILDMNDASQTLTILIADRWKQKKYEVMFQADGQHFITFVKDVGGKALIPLEERSKGFQWFFSFDMRFMYETKGNFQNAIILLDEPGLHLHASAQRDLLERMKAYSTGNQLIYSTHLPFMINFKRLDNIYVAEEIGVEGSKIHKNWGTADKDARFTLQAALGLSWSQSLFVGQFNLVVEGVDDFWFLTAFSSLFEEAGQTGIDSRLTITPAGGASKVAYVGTILKGQDLNVAVLLDSDPAGEQAFGQLVHSWILKDNFVIMVGDAIGEKPSSIEDFFGEPYYLSKVNQAYAKELAGTNLVIDPRTAGRRSIVERVESAFESRGLGVYNKGRVAKRIMSEIGRVSLSAIDASTAAKFRKLIDAINAVSSKWV
jgi:predicted ATPase